MTALGLPGEAFVIVVLFAWPLGRPGVLGRRSMRPARLRFRKPQP